MTIMASASCAVQEQAALPIPVTGPGSGAAFTDRTPAKQQHVCAHPREHPRTRPDLSHPATHGRSRRPGGWRRHAWFPHVCDLPKGRFRASTLAAELETKRLGSPLGSPIPDIRNQMSAPFDCAEHVRRRVATLSAFLTTGFSCVYQPTVNGKPRINRGYHRP